MALHVATASRRSRRAARRASGKRRRATWMLPLAVVFILNLKAFVPIANVDNLIAVTLGIGIVVAAARRPGPALLVLVGLLPFTLLGFAQALAWGVPAQLIYPLLRWKELLLAGVVLAGIMGFRRAKRKLDRLDIVALIFVSLVGIYALFPRLFNDTAPLLSDLRSQGFRFGALFVLLLLGARHADLPPSFAEALTRTVLLVTTGIALIGIFEFFFSVRWNDYLVNTAQLPRYYVQILGVPTTSIRSYTDLRVPSTVGGGSVFRIGSVFANPLTAGFYLVPGFALAVERTVRGGVRAALFACVAIGGALMLTQTRAAILAGLVVCMLAFRPAPGRQTERRVRFAFILAAAMVLAIPAAASSGFAERAGSVVGSNDVSTNLHWESLRYGVNTLIAHPLGEGIGTSAGAGQRFFSNVKVSENYYLQVGDEMGVFTMLAFIGVTLLMLGGLRRVTQESESEVAAAYFGAGCGLAIGALLLHTWNDLSVAWAFWGGAGAVMAMLRRPEDPAPTLLIGAPEILRR